MATVENPNDYAISSDAMDVMDCFSNGMDQVVHQMAGRIAEQRNKSSGEVVITIPDIEAAVRHFAEVMQRSDLEPAVKVSVSSMLDCCA